MDFTPCSSSTSSSRWIISCGLLSEQRGSFTVNVLSERTWRSHYLSGLTNANSFYGLQIRRHGPLISIKKWGNSQVAESIREENVDGCFAWDGETDAQICGRKSREQKKQVHVYRDKVRAAHRLTDTISHGAACEICQRRGWALATGNYFTRREDYKWTQSWSDLSHF